MYRYVHKNVRPFSAVCQNNYGRQVIFTRKRQITKNNIIEELNKALVIHEQNAIEIEYLDRYYRGDQPILYRQKVNRPEINNKIAVNLAYELVERKTAEMCAEPIQYVLRGTDNHKSEEITQLNITMDSEISSDGSQCGTVISDNGISANLVAGTHGYANSHIATQYRIRKLTPRECGRLMGVSDEDIDKMAAVNSNTQLYKQFGNSIVVDIMCAMFKNLNIKQGDNNEALQTN